MARAVYYHENRVEIAFAHDNQEHQVSLLPYLQRPSEAVAVVYEIWNESTVEEEARWLVQTAGEKVDLVHQGIMHHADRLSGPQRKVTLLAEDDAIHVTLVAELLSPATVVHSLKIDVSPTSSSEINTWINRSVTLEGGDSAADVEAVILLTRRVDLESGGQSVGLRGLGSTSTRLWRQAYHSCNQWFPVAAPNGNYQLYVTGGTEKGGGWWFNSYVWELGYIKKGHAFVSILNWTNESPTKSTSWVTKTASSQVPGGADGMFAVQRDLNDQIPLPELGLWWHGLRKIGSSDDERICPSAAAQDSADPVRLNSQKQYEFFQPDDPELYILAYTMLAEAAGSGTAKLVDQATPVVRTFPTATAILQGIASASPVVRASASGTGIAKLIGIQATPTRPATLSATPALESMLSADPGMESVFSAIPECLSMLSATPDLESVLSGDPDIGDVLSGKPAVTE